jgi:hypothetical protein
MTESGPEKIKLSVEERIENLNTQINIIISNNPSSRYKLSGIQGEITDLQEENPLEQGDERFEEKLKELEQKIIEIETPDPEGE